MAAHHHDGRMAGGREHETRVRNALRDMGALVEPFGIERFSRSMREVLQVVPNQTSPLRSLPDFLVGFEDGTSALVEAKWETNEHADVYNINTDAVSHYWHMQCAFGVRIWIVWRNMRITPVDWLHGGGKHVRKGPFVPKRPRTPYWQFPKADVPTKPLETLQSKSREYLEDMWALPTITEIAIDAVART